MVNGSSGLSAHLRFVWRVALFFMKSGKALNATYAGFVTILTIGAGYFVQLHKQTWQIVVTVILCLAGIGAATFAMMQLSQGGGSATLRWFGGFATDAAAESAADVFFSALIFWFAVFLAAELGISLGAQGGALAKYLPGQWSGKTA
jgi:hypothetical protein